MDGGGAGATEVAAARALTAEEEAAKRNTDCVYFLASPLTCKKGNECEYRHSEGARVNHRDCWYWLNGNCLNPRCSFRHPPLDGLLGVSRMTSVPAPSSQTVVTTQYPADAPYNPNKQGVVCYFFQQGQCLKGDKCSFVHGPQPTGPVPQKVGKVSVSATEPAQPLKESWALKACTQHNMPKASVDNQAEVLPFSAKPVTRDNILTSNGFAHKRSSSPYNLESMLPRIHPIDFPASSDIASSMPQSHLAEPLDEYPQNGREDDEFLAESSPGFDVLADNVTEATGYVHGEDDFGRESVQGGMDLYPVSDFNFHHSDFEHVTDFRKDQYNGIDEYDQYGHVSNHYGRDQRRSSSERILERQLSHEKRVRQRESPEEIDSLDLRHQLMKHRRLNGPTSTVSPYRHGEPYRRDDHKRLNGSRSIASPDRRGEAYRRDDHRRLYGSRSTVSPGRRSEPYRRDDRRRLNGSRSTASPERRGELYRRDDRYAEVEMYRGRRSHGDRQHLLSDSGLSSRLQGRIKLPATSSPDRLVDPRSEREWDSARHQGRLSPGRPINYPLRNGRIKQSSYEDFAAVTRNFRDQSFREDNADPLDFAGPKSLAELRGEKISEKSQEQSVKSNSTARHSPESRGMESGHPLDNHGSVVSLSFKSTEPLSNILNGKGEADPDNSLISGNDGNNHRDGTVGGYMTAAVLDVQVNHSSKAVKGSNTVPIMPESKAGASEESEAGEYAQSMARNIAEMEETMITSTDGNKDLGNSDQMNKELNYETIEDGDAKANDDEHLYREDEEIDDEDEDDFARKVGVIFS